VTYGKHGGVGAGTLSRIALKGILSGFSKGENKNSG
jgi:hypothetical protein